MQLDYWNDHLSDEEREVVVRGKYGKRHRLGQRPALVLVDLQYN